MSVSCALELEREKDCLDWEGDVANSIAARPVHRSSFNVHGVLYVEDSGEVAPVEAEIRALSTGLQGVKDEQEYIVVRERVHRDSECLNFRRASREWWRDG